MYSFRMSFCTVPRSCFGSTPCLRATAITIASRIAAGALIVMLMLTLSSGMPSSSVSMSASDEIATPDLADFAQRQRIVGVVADLGRQVECDAQPGLPLRQQVAVALVALGRGAETRHTGASSRSGRGTWSAGRPRVNGYSPGKPRFSRYSSPTGGHASATASGVYTRSTGMPELVSNFADRSGAFASVLATVLDSQAVLRSESWLMCAPCGGLGARDQGLGISNRGPQYPVPNP